jgi:hypothetical protein
MSQCPLAHFSLGRTPPLPEHPCAKVVFTIALGTDGRQISLVMQQEGKSGQDYIAIEEDTLVEIVLRGDQLFFSKEFDAITMKGANLDFFYGAIEYGHYERDYDRYKSVHFVARYNKGGKVGTTHGFNVNVDLLQHGGSHPRWIGLTIDPDIKNPPPKLT